MIGTDHIKKAHHRAGIKSIEPTKAHHRTEKQVIKRDVIETTRVLRDTKKAAAIIKIHDQTETHIDATTGIDTRTDIDTVVLSRPRRQIILTQLIRRRIEEKKEIVVVIGSIVEEIDLTQGIGEVIMIEIVNMGRKANGLKSLNIMIIDLAKLRINLKILKKKKLT